MLKSSVPWRKLAAAGILAAGACLLLAILVIGTDDKNATGRDFIQYWALEQQLAHRANPYNADAILRIERAVGMDKPGVLISLSPPVGFACSAAGLGQRQNRAHPVDAAAACLPGHFDLDPVVTVRAS